MITIVITYYDSPNMLKKQFETMHTYSQWTLDRLSVIVVDDGSQNHPAREVFKEGRLPGVKNVELYQIKQNIPWNYGGARNLGFHVVKDGWVFSIDIDHIIPGKSIERLLQMNLNRNCFYNPDRKPKRHRDTIIIHRQKFWEVGGFNEDFAGYYGGDDNAFHRELERRAKKIQLKDVHIVFCREVDDAQVSDWGRQGTKYHHRENEKMLKLANKLMRKYKAGKPLRFDWEKVEV